MATMSKSNTVPPSVGGGQGAPPDHERFLRSLRASATDQDVIAYLEWRLGVLEARQGDLQGAVQRWLSAFNQMPMVRLALWELLQVFEERKSLRNLERLYVAQGKASRTPHEQASALLSLIALEDNEEAEVERLRSFFEGLTASRVHAELDAGQTGAAWLAHDLPPTDPVVATAALWLERIARRRGDNELLRVAMRGRVLASVSPEWRAILLLDLADLELKAGMPESALALTRRAAQTDPGRLRAVRAFSRLARGQENAAVLAEALQAELDLSLAGENRDEDRAHVALIRLELGQLFLGPLAAPEKTIALLEPVIDRPLDDLQLVLFAEAAALARDTAALERVAQIAEERARGEVQGHAHLSIVLLLAVAFLEPDPDSDEVNVRRIETAIAVDPNSALLRRVRRALLLTRGDPDELVQALEDDADNDPAQRVTALWQAATVAAVALDHDTAKRLFLAAVHWAREEQKWLVLRDAIAFGARIRDAAFTRQVSSVLAAASLTASEQAGADFERFLSLSTPERVNYLREAWHDPQRATWARPRARVVAAADGDYDWLAEIHLAEAEELEGDERNGAACAAARALLRAGELERAEQELAAVLESAPDHPYALPLLADLYRRNGNTTGVHKLLARAQAGRGVAGRFLRESLIADPSTLPEQLVNRLRDALVADPDNTSSLLAAEYYAYDHRAKPFLRELRGHRVDRERLQRTFGYPSLVAAEEFLFGERPAHAIPLLRSLLDSEMSLEAAVAMLLAPGRLRGDDDSVAEKHLLEWAVREEAPPLVVRWLRDSVGRGEDVLGREERDLAEHWKVLATSRDSVDVCDALCGMADSTVDENVAVACLLAASRELLLMGEDADAYLLAQELAERAPASVEAAIALEETQSPNEDPGSVADALTIRLMHASELELPELRISAARALEEAGRFRHAYGLLREALAAAPHDAAALESLRNVGRKLARTSEDPTEVARAWEDVARAAANLADRIGGAARAELLHEAAILWMDELGDTDEAVAALREVLREVPGKAGAFDRLRDLLLEKGDRLGVIALIDARLSAGGAVTDELLFDKARLHRELGNLDAAVGAVADVLVVRPDHVAALALSVEIFVHEERWSDAVDSLDRIARCDVPKAQARIARLGAADLLERKLFQPAGALAQLDAVVEIGLADAQVHRRRAQLAMELGHFEVASSALAAAAQAETGAERTALYRLSARLYGTHRGVNFAVAELERLWREVLAGSPTDAEAARELGKLYFGREQRWTFAAGYEQSVRAELDRLGASPELLRSLRVAAQLKGDDLLEHAVLQSLVALAVATTEEIEQIEDVTGLFIRPNLLRMSSTFLQGIAVVGDDAASPVFEVARIAEETVSSVLAEATVVSGSQRSGVLFDELSAYCKVVGVEIESVQSCAEANMFDALLRGRALTWYVGSSIRPPLDAKRLCHLGARVYAASRGLSHLFFGGGKAAAERMSAIFAASGVALSVGSGAAQNDWLRAKLEAALSKRQKKSVQDLARRIVTEQRNVEAEVNAFRASAARVGALLAADIEASLQVALEGVPPELELVRQSPAASALMRFWIASETSGLRKELLR